MDCKACRQSRTDAECAAKNYRNKGYKNVRVMFCNKCNGYFIEKEK